MATTSKFDFGLINDQIKEHTDQIGNVALPTIAQTLTGAISENHSDIVTIRTAKNGIAKKFTGSSTSPVSVLTGQNGCFIFIGFISGRGNDILAIKKTRTNLIVKDLTGLSDFSSGLMTVTSDIDNLYFTFTDSGVSTFTLIAYYGQEGF